MTFETSRQTIAAAIKAVQPVGMALVIDNDPFDWANAPRVFHHIEISFEGGSQIGMSSDPRSRYSGYVRLRTHLQGGIGVRPAAEAMDWFKGALEYQVLAAAGLRITFESLKPDGANSTKGWCMHDSHVFFRVHPA